MIVPVKFPMPIKDKDIPAGGIWSLSDEHFINGVFIDRPLFNKIKRKLGKKEWERMVKG